MKKNVLCVSGLIVALVLVGAILTGQAAGLWNRGTHLINSIWMMDRNAEIRFMPGSTLRLDTGSAVDATGVITSTNIADITRSIPFALPAAYVAASGAITTATVPALQAATADAVPIIVYADSSEVASFGYSFTLPPDYVSGLGFRMMISSDTSTAYASIAVGFSMVLNEDSASFGAEVAESPVYNTVTTPAASNCLLTFTPVNTTGFAAGKKVTVYFANFDRRIAAQTLEIKAIEARYTATQ